MERLLDAHTNDVGRLRVEREEALLLVGEVLVERALRDARVLHDVRDRRGRISAFGYGRREALEEPQAMNRRVFRLFLLHGLHLGTRWYHSLRYALVPSVFCGRNRHDR